MDEAIKAINELLITQDDINKSLLRRVEALEKRLESLNDPTKVDGYPFK
jgi:hypothetical protein